MFKVAKLVQAGGNKLQDRAEFFYYGPNLVLVVADGAGGISGGSGAAEFVVHQVKEAICSNTLDIGNLNAFLSSTDKQMAEAGNFGETTAVIVVMTNQQITGTSVGDSGAWIISQSGVDNLTATQSRKPFIGSGRAAPIAFERPDINGTLLLASDGLLKYASSDRIAELALNSDIELAASKLIELVRYPSGALPDDVSVVLVRSTQVS